jgi:anthranilate/para-aminobenzoate synthase component I
MYSPSLEGFIARSKEGNLVPVYREILADLETPVSAFLKIGGRPHSFLLESVAGGEQIGRYSFIGGEPFMVVKTKGRNVEIFRDGQREGRELAPGEDPLHVLKELMAGLRFVKDPDLPPFCGGAVGYVGYDTVRFFERLPDLKPDDRHLPDCYFVFTDTLLIFDHVKHHIKVLCLARVDGDPRAAYHAALEKIDRLVAQLKRPLSYGTIEALAHPYNSQEQGEELGGDPLSPEEEPPATIILNGILQRGVLSRASEICVVPTPDAAQVRFQGSTGSGEVLRLSQDVYPKLLQRLKLLSGVNFTEGRYPQDRHFLVQLVGKQYYVNVNFFPTECGEGVALRIVDHSTEESTRARLEPISIPSQEEHTAAVLKAKEYIAAGDIIQVVLSRRIQVDVTASPFQIYRALRSVNPSPYMFFLQFEDCQLIGASPEILVTERAGHVVTRPIAGTVRRGKTPEEDAQLEAQLLADPKERAEHIMLVDLHRNDIGRVCEYGSVHVDQLMVTEKYSHVIHIVSNVVGKLRPDRDAYDLIRAAFPAGTLSGAPKIRAMEIIEELEPVKRGPYGGCIGYFSFSGDMDTAITLRTIVMKGNTAYVQVGGGIVADSDPDAEYQETVSKSGALMRAIEMAEAGLE